MAGTVLPPRPQRQDSPAARAAGLIAVAEDLAGEFSLRPLLERILRRCTELLECDAGSICSVDEAAGTYRKEADIGVACQSGRVFPLTEGMTGAVVARRAPAWFARYDQVPGGHVAPEERATLRGVIGVPLEWRGRIIGACIVFSRDERREFGPDDAELLQLFAKHAAIALANSRMHEAAEERARTEAAAAERDRLLGELHDTLAQRLVSVQAHLDSVQRELAAGGDRHDDATNGPPRWPSTSGRPPRRPGRPWWRPGRRCWACPRRPTAWTWRPRSSPRRPGPRRSASSRCGWCRPAPRSRSRARWPGS